MAYSAQKRTPSLRAVPVLQFGAARQESTEPGDDVPASLPSKDVWVHSGNMSKKIVSNQGVKFQTRFAVLTSENLYFTKQYDDTYMPRLSSTTNEDQLQSVFKKYDEDESG
jgi:hypothetical protein